MSKGTATLLTRIIFRFRLPDPSPYCSLVVDHMAIVTSFYYYLFDFDGEHKKYTSCIECIECIITQEYLQMVCVLCSPAKKSNQNVGVAKQFLCWIGDVCIEVAANANFPGWRRLSVPSQYSSHAQQVTFVCVIDYAVCAV